MRPACFQYKVNGQYLLSLWLFVASEQHRMFLRELCELFLVSEILIISITITLLDFAVVALGFLRFPITGPLKQPEQMFTSRRLTSLENAGCY